LAKTQSRRPRLLKTISRALAVFALAALNQCNFGVGTAAAPSLLGLADVAESVYTHSRTETCVCVCDGRIFVILIYPALSAAAAAHSHSRPRLFFITSPARINRLENCTIHHR
jgi:hypothetical protein